ncbi:glucuronide carrier protein [Corynebacterium renale]|uniref:cytidylate kinase family protein n=1 Tax=Corynebacterium renale TaxID=1724 RepID=UPI000DA2733D|nr:cytidylate kinase family protein [Corynebacterium renale]SQG64234.1 glucuronide carrier protein [Corynebacterium renale]STC94676.1 glucuronide carrier protein [Corynebacterium renale]
MSVSTTQAPAESKRLSNGTVISYALGDVANNLTFMMTSMFLMVFMTDIAGVGAGIAGTIYGVTKVWAGVSDLIAGQTVDRINTRWGRLRPWILYVSAPLVIVFVLLFSIPAGLSPAITIAWILLFDALYQLAYSFINIPYGSLSAAMTQDPVDRSRLSGARSITSSLASVVLAFVIAPQFQDTAADNIRLKFTLITAGLGVVALCLYLICFKNTRETVERPSSKITLKSTFKAVRSNKPLLILCFGALFLLASMFTMNAVGLYYARDVLGNAGWYAYLMVAQTLGSILIASFVPAITTKFGKRLGYAFSAAAVIVSFVIIFLAPAGSLIVGLVGWFIYGVGIGGTNALMFSMQADTVDYGEWKTGVRSEGGSYSMLSFIRKVGQGVGGWVAGVVIGIYGYEAGAAVQSTESIEGIRIATGAVPAVLAVVALLIMLRYPLDLDTHTTIVRELNQRRTNKAVASSTGRSDVSTPGTGDGRTTLLREKGESAPPIITLFGTSGSGASIIGPMLAAKLGVPYIGQRFSAEELALVDHKALATDSAFDRWMRKVAYTGTQDATMAAASGTAQNNMIAENNTKEVLEKVANGGVILGRNGAFVLHHVVGALHVRLMAPKRKRIERVMQRTGLNAAQAQTQLEGEDRMRSEMAIHLYQWEPNNEHYYDLIINTGSVTYEQIVDTIIELYQTKYPENKPDPDAVDEIIDLKKLWEDAKGEGSEDDIKF